MTYKPKELSNGAVIEAIVGTVHSSYVATYTRSESAVPRGTNVTFSISAWAGTTVPQKGQVVKLTEIVQFAKGWRANRAEPITLQQ